jgi:hypothetical protein
MVSYYQPVTLENAKTQCCSYSMIIEDMAFVPRAFDSLSKTGYVNVCLELPDI